MTEVFYKETMTKPTNNMLEPWPLRARAFLKFDCPFSLKFLLFMTEAGLLEKISIVRCVPEEDGYDEVITLLKGRLGAKPTFPTVEIEPGVFKSDSDALIEHFVRKHRIDVDQMFTLDFYQKGVFLRIIELYKENVLLKKAADA